ncbi:hypothetical protein PGT21_013738 [Puccinia graminis f. sp. tritici]|uniref:Uncharacterized protein n=1 Tax=Puccinia graminis f. sp. tritici TaxID=56615 RepID=A0A5B0MJ29_PUCGR|nr:hypothetical protein PGT21_013738 [Puccinia graminis f. sp. tritici]KAA1126796.1 hypothetical protein PGTUg99_021273 [Puccinia graminis f. sp. tritici]
MLPKKPVNLTDGDSQFPFQPNSVLGPRENLLPCALNFLLIVCTPPERVSDARLLDAAFDGGLAQPTPTRSLGAFHSGRPHQGSGLAAVGLPSSQCLPEALELTAVGLLFDAGKDGNWAGVSNGPPEPDRVWAGFGPSFS